MMQFTRIFLVLTLFLCILSGCSRQERPDGLPTLYPCTITVTQGGQPLEGALVRLVPESGSSGWTIGGKTKENGTAKIITHTDFAGAPAGVFKVLISKVEKAPSKYEQPKDIHSQEWKEWFGKSSNEVLPTFRYVKAEFGDITKTPNSITIEKGKNNATFDVGEPIKEEVK